MKKGNWIGMLPFYLLAAIICIGAARIGSGAVTASVQSEGVERNHRIVIDAGHGGIDGGATSCTGVLESTINLQIALRLNDLMHLLGYETVMIRTTDTSVYTEGNTIAAQKVSDLKERVRIVNETENAILISIHQNIFPDSRYDGAQVFYAPTEGIGPGDAAGLMYSTQMQKRGFCVPASKYRYHWHSGRVRILIQSRGGSKTPGPRLSAASMW